MCVWEVHLVILGEGQEEQEEGGWETSRYEQATRSLYTRAKYRYLIKAGRGQGYIHPHPLPFPSEQTPLHPSREGQGVARERGYLNLASLRPNPAKGWL